jgi:hypothetical protein
MIKLLCKVAIGSCCVAILLFVVLWLTAKQNSPTPIELPLPGEVDMLTAEVHDIKGLSRGRVPEFALPNRYIRDILGILAPAVPWSEHPSEHLLVPLANLNIRTKTGAFMAIVVLHYGQMPACFSIDGVICMRGGQYSPVARTGDDFDVYSDESLAFCTLIRDISLEAKGQRQERGVNNMLDQLRRSRGELPPE